MKTNKSLISKTPRLKNSWELISDFESIKNRILPELKDEISKYINNFTESGKTNGYFYPVTNYVFRGNLQLVLENAHKPEIIVEICKINSQSVW